MSSACGVCGAKASPLSASTGLDAFMAHLNDRNDPHHVLELVPKTHTGVGTPEPADGYRVGDWYIDMSTGRLFSYQETDDGNVWTPLTSDFGDRLSAYATVEHVDRALESYLTSEDASKDYVAKSDYQSLESKVVSCEAGLASAVTRKSGSRDLDTVLSDYLRVADVDTAVAGKQDRLTAGTNVSIQNNVISVTVPQTPVATQTTPGLMSPSDKTALAGLGTTSASLTSSLSELTVRLNGMQPALTDENAGDNVTISSGRISVSIPDATETASGLMSAADKQRLASMVQASSSFVFEPLSLLSSSVPGVGLRILKDRSLNHFIVQAATSTEVEKFRFPAFDRDRPREFYVVISFESPWTSSKTFSIDGFETTSDEQVHIMSDLNANDFKSIQSSPGNLVVFHFIEVTPHVFRASRTKLHSTYKNGSYDV